MTRLSAGTYKGAAAPIRQPKLEAPMKENNGGATASQMTYLKKTRCGSGRVSDSSSNTAAGRNSSRNSIQFAMSVFIPAAG